MIEFDREYNAYGELSNFYACDLVYQGKHYPSAEHLYQARKYLDHPSDENETYAELVRTTSRPWGAKLLGQRSKMQVFKWPLPLNEIIDAHQPTMCPDWNERKLHVMKEVLLCKFQQSEQCRRVLLATGDAQLVLDMRDPYWGNGKGGGANNLGQLLQEVRAESNISASA